MADSRSRAPTPLERLQMLQVRTFVLTWSSYASYYLTRKPISVVKVRLQEELGLSTWTLSMMDTGYLAAYAAGQFICGNLGDRLGARRLLGTGMLGAAALAMLFGLSSMPMLLLLFWTLTGFFQASGWPGNVKAMTPWFEKRRRGRVMGLWSTCYQVGGIAGTALATFLLVHWGWRSSFLVPALLVAGVGILVFAFLVNSPDEAGLKGPELSESTQPAGVHRSDSDGAMTFLEALRLPGILNLGGAYFCLKLIRYTILFWLPMYLVKALGYSEEAGGYLSTSFEVGGILGAITIGYLSDKYAAGRRVLFAAPLVLLIGAALALYQWVGAWGMVPNVLAMGLVGFLLFGPDSLLSGAAAQDLGGNRAAGKAAGIINGLGSVGAILQGFMTAYLSENYGWEYLFYALILLCAIAAAILMPVFLKDLRQRV